MSRCCGRCRGRRTPGARPPWSGSPVRSAGLAMNWMPRPCTGDRSVRGRLFAVLGASPSATIWSPTRFPGTSWKVICGCQGRAPEIPTRSPTAPPQPLGHATAACSPPQPVDDPGGADLAPTVENGRCCRSPRSVSICRTWRMPHWTPRCRWPSRGLVRTTTPPRLAVIAMGKPCGNSITSAMSTIFVGENADPTVTRGG